MEGRPILGALMVLASVTGISAMVSGTTVPLTGPWGGDRLNLDLTDEGGSLSLDCATGRFEGSVRPDSAGHFKAKGHWTQHSAGPQRADEAPAAHTAQFEGHVANGTMHLKVTAQGASQMFTLAQDARVKLVRCL